MGTELNYKGYKLAAIKDESKCLACGYCELICPEFAITLILNVNAHKSEEKHPV